jgi:hypothetical protein
MKLSINCTPFRTRILPSLALGLSLLFGGDAVGQATSAGSETLVNTTTANDQKRPEVAVAPNGDYVVVWMSEDEDGSDQGVYWQMYSAGGTPNGAATKANVTTNYGQRDPDVAIAADGSFVVTWASQYEDTDGWGVWFALYDNTGALLQRNRVNDSSNDEQIHPAVAMRYDGSFVVGYMDDGQDGDNWGISYQGFSNAGVAQFAELVPNSTVTGWQGHPDVAMDSAGNYTWVWQDYALDGSDAGIFMQRYDKNDNAVGSETQVNTTTAGNQINPSIEMDNEGNTMIAWSSYGQDGDHYGIVAQIFDNSGSAVGGEIDVNTTTADVQDFASVSVSANNVFVVAWTSWNQDGDAAGVYMQDFKADGTMFGTEQRVNSTTSNYQALPSVSGHEDTGELVVVWQSGANNTLTTQDGDSYGVYSQRYSVADVTDPIAICQNITIYLDGTGNATITATDVDGGSTDNWGVTNYSIDISAFTCADIGSNSVILTVQDAAGNSDGCAAVVTVADNTSPTASCQNLTVYLDGTGNASVNASDYNNGSADNCTSVSFGADITAFTCADVGTLTATLTVTDGSSNTATCTSTVTVIDSISPTAACQNITVNLDATGNITIAGIDIDGGSTDNCSALTYGASTTAFTCADLGSNSVTLTVTDASGNTSTCVALVTIADNLAPTATCQNITVYLDGSGSATITAGDVDGGSTDNCTTVSTGIDISSFTCADLGTNAVTLTATDGSSNSATCTATVTVMDSTSPTASCQNLTVYLDGTGNASITSGDVDAGSTDNCSSVTTGIDISSFACADLGTNTVTLTATDGSANTATCTATVTVIDSTSPTAVCQNITVSLDATGNVTIAATDINNGSSDNCTGLTYSASATTFSCADIGTNSVTLTVTDASGNTSTCVAVVTVQDVLAPTALCQDITVYLDGSGNATITSGDVDGGSTDNCTTVTTGIDISAFTCADLGANTVTLTATDGSSNSASCTATVTVVDSTSPTASCQNLTVYLDGAGNATIVGGDIDNGSSDNCSTVVLSADITAFTCANVGANTVTLTATDGSANTASCTATVTVIDSTSPTASCQSITVYLDASGNATIAATDIDNGSADNCTSVSLAADITAFTCNEVGANTVTLTVTDASSNEASCTATVTVLDSISPTITSCPADMAVTTNTGGCQSIVSWVDPTIADNCTFTTIQSHTSGSTFPVGVTTVTYTVTDAGGNTAVCSFTVTVTNDLAVSLVGTDVLCNGDSTGTATSTVSGGTAPYSYAWSTGEVGVDELSLGAGTHSVIVTDANGCTATINVTINEPVPFVATATSTDALCFGTSTGTATITISGGTAPYTEDWAGQDPNALAAGTHTWIVTDANGCIVTNAVTINEPALLTATTDSTLAGCGLNNGSAWVTATGGTTGYTYLWDASAGNQTTDTAFTLAAGAYTVTVTDANGCTAIEVATVTNPNGPQVTVVGVDLLCFADSNGTATATITGGTAPFVYTWTNGDTGPNADSLAAGNYSVNVIDAASCGGSAVVTINEPTAITATDSLVMVDCNGNTTGEAIVTPAGGTPNYTFDWFGADPNGLAAGTWPYTITDANGCVYSDSVVITEPTVLAATSSVTDVVCNADSTGTASITIVGGTAGYSTDWFGMDAAALPAGTFTYVVTDTNGCSYTDSVTIAEPTALTSNTDSIAADCGTSNGTGWVTVGGGTPGYSYLWDANAGNQTTDTATNLAAGVYYITVTDTNGCSITDSATVINPGAPIINMVSQDVLCFGDSNGVADATFITGPSPFTFVWNTGDTLSVIDSLAPGSYTVTVTDSALCTATETVVIGEPAQLAATDSTTDANCNGEGSGTSTLFITGGTSPFIEDWLGEDPNALFAGTWDYDLIDANGCAVSGTVSVNEPTALDLSATTTDEILVGSGEIDLLVTGGTGSYLYDWDNGAVTQDLTGLTGNAYYFVTVTDSLGCTDTLTVFVASQVGIETPDGRKLDFEVYPNPNDGNFSLNLIGAWDLEDARIVMTDAIGKVVFLQENVSNTSMKINIAPHVERGTYFITVYQGDVRFTLPLILQ